MRNKYDEDVDVSRLRVPFFVDEDEDDFDDDSWGDSPDEPKTKSNTESKPEPKSEPKTASKPEPKSEPKPAQKSEPKADAKAKAPRIVILPPGWTDMWYNLPDGPHELQVAHDRMSGEDYAPVASVILAYNLAGNSYDYDPVYVWIINHRISRKLSAAEKVRYFGGRH